MQKIPKKYQKLIFNDSQTLSGEKYSLKYVKDFLAILNLPTAQLANTINSFAALNILNNTYPNIHRFDELIMALRDGLITPEQAALMYCRLLGVIITKGCMECLRDKLITIEQVIRMPTHIHVESLVCNRESRDALRKGFITPDEISRISNYMDIYSYRDNKIRDVNSTSSPPRNF